MNRLKKNLYLLKCIIEDCHGLVGLIFFHITISACFLIFFFTIGINLYNQVRILEDNVREINYANVQLEDMSDMDQVRALLNECKNAKYCIVGGITEECEYTLGWFENHNLVDKNSDCFLKVNGKLEEGIIIQSKVYEQLGLGDENLNIGKELKEQQISAIIDSDKDSFFNFYEKDIYINLKSIKSNLKNEEINFIMDNSTYEQIHKELSSLDVSAIESNSNLHSITNAVKIIKIVLCIFGIFFSIVVSIQIIDLFGLLIEKKKGKFFMLCALGYCEGDIRKVTSISSAFGVMICTGFGFFVCKSWASYLMIKNANDELFGVPIRELLTIKMDIVLPCIIVLTICVIIYASLSMRKLKGDNIISGLNEME